VISILDQGPRAEANTPSAWRIRQVVRRNEQALGTSGGYGLVELKEKRMETRTPTRDVEIPYLGFGTYRIGNEES
jgi:hypothetical protein